MLKERAGQLFQLGHILSCMHAVSVGRQGKQHADCCLNEHRVRMQLKHADFGLIGHAIRMHKPKHAGSMCQVAGGMPGQHAGWAESGLCKRSDCHDMYMYVMSTELQASCITRGV